MLDYLLLFLLYGLPVTLLVLALRRRVRRDSDRDGR